MVRLIVDDAGSRRAFNVGDGRLTVGSGQEAKLKLTSSGVASVHVELEIVGNKATLHPMAGVTPPHVLGRATTSSVVLQHGVPVKFGSATITVEYEGQPSKLDAAKPGHAGAPDRIRRRDEREQDEEGGRPHRARKQGVPTWVWIAGGVPVLALLGFFAVSKLLGKGTRMQEASAGAYYQNALDRFRNSQYPQAKEQLALIPADANLAPDLAANVAKLRADLDRKIAEAEEYETNEIEGTKYFESQLKGFSDSFMKGQITSPQARVFLQRAAYFRERWPKHAQLEWVSRQEARFKGAVDLSKPPTYEDIEFQVKALTWTSPRNYREAFEVVRKYQGTASPADAQKAAALLADLEKKRGEWFEDRKQQARWHYDRKEEGKAVGVLLSLIRYSGDETMADWGATELMKFGDMVTWLRGYKANDARGFEEISKNRVIAEFIKKNPL